LNLPPVEVTLPDTVRVVPFNTKVLFVPLKFNEPPIVMSLGGVKVHALAKFNLFLKEAIVCF
jgi:hypothetical protein